MSEIDPEKILAAYQAQHRAEVSRQGGLRWGVWIALLFIVIMAFLLLGGLLFYLEKQLPAKEVPHEIKSIGNRGKIPLPNVIPSSNIPLVAARLHRSLSPCIHG